MVKSMLKNGKTMLIGYTIFFVLFFLGSVNVKAIGDVEHNYLDQYLVKAYTPPVITQITTPASGDLITINVQKGSNTVTGFYIQDINDAANSFKVEASREMSSYYLSLRNGTYKIYVIDSTNQTSAFYHNITVNTSCTNDKAAIDVTGKGTVRRCFIYNGSKLYADSSVGDIVTCKAGYIFDMTSTGLIDGCSSFNVNGDKDTKTGMNKYDASDISVLTKYEVSRRFCQRTYQYNCVADTTNASSTLKSLSLSSGTLSPAFNASTTSYTATVNASSVSINATLNSDGSSFETGYGPRTVKLNYGANSYAIKVKSASGNITTYTIKITRPDNRSRVNTLSALYIDGVKFNETFSASKTSYTATVASDVDKVYINATLTNSSSSFVQGYGPRTVNLTTGGNSIAIKVKSQAGTTKTYTIKITKEGNKPDPEPPLDTENLGLLKSLTFKNEGLTLEPEFSPKNLEYNMTVPYEINTLLVDAVAENSTDTIVIEGNEELVVEEANVVTIKVTTKEEFIRVYTINVIRKGEELVISSDSTLKELTIEGKEIEFDPATQEYGIILEKDETQLGINAVANDEKATVEVLDNEGLVSGSKVTVRVIAEDSSFTDYIINIDGVEKGSNIFLIVIIVLILVLVIAYTILRIMGYKIYFNFSMLGSLFRSFGKKDE